MVKQSRFKQKPKQKVSNKPSPKYRTRFTEPGPSKKEFGALTGFKVGIGQDQPSRASFVSELLNRIRASRVPNLQHVKYPTRRLRPTAMGSRKLAMELWRKKETDFLRTLPRLRWFHSPQSKPDQIMEVLRSGSTKHSSVNSYSITKVILENNEIPLLHRRQYTTECIIRSWPSSQVMKNYGTNPMNPCIVRSFSSKASKEPGKTPDENKKDISKVEDPFDAPTYNIPEKPVTFTEGASYSLIILVGLGIAAAAGYAVFKELIFEPKEYKIFNKALKRIQDDAEVRVRIGYPITGYGQESRNRAARQRIPNRTWTDEDGVEHVEVNFYIRGPHGAGKVFAEMYKDQTDKQWKFTYLIVEIRSPSPAQLILESYLPSYAPA